MVGHDYNEKLIGKYQETRLCDNCRTKQPKHTGFMQKFNNGLNQRWVCVKCKEKIADSEF